MSQTPNRRVSARPKKDDLRQSKTDPATLRTPKTKALKDPKPKPTKTSPKASPSQVAQIKKESGGDAPMTPPKPGSSQLRLSISNNAINLDHSDPSQKSVLESLNNSDSNSSREASTNDTLDKISEIHAEEFELGEPTVPLIQIPNEIRTEAGQQWRLKEAIMNSFHFGKASIRASEFARSDSDLKTAEVVASDAHTLDSKKFRVKLHLGMLALIKILAILDNFSQLSKMASISNSLYCFNFRKKKI